MLNRSRIIRDITYPILFILASSTVGCALFTPQPAAEHRRGPSTRPAQRVEVVESQPAPSESSGKPAPPQTDAGMTSVETWASNLAKQREARSQTAAPAPTSMEPSPAALTGQTPTPAGGAPPRYESSGSTNDYVIKPAPGEPPPGEGEPLQLTPAAPEARRAGPRKVVPAERINGAAPGDAPVRRVDPPAGTGKGGSAASPAAVPAAPRISVNPGPTSIESSNEAPPSGVNQPSDAGHAVSGLRELLDQWKEQSAESTLREQLDRRLVAMLAGDYEQARKPLDMASGPHQAMVSRFIESLITLRRAGGASPGEEAAGVLRQVEQLRESLLPATDLTVSNLEICKSVRGFGQYEAMDSGRLVAGRESSFVVYCELRDFVSEKRDDGLFHSSFGLKIAVMNRNGDVVSDQLVENLSDKCRTRRTDCFLSPVVRLPSSLSAGEYVVKVTVTDKIGKKVAERIVPVRLEARGSS